MVAKINPAESLIDDELTPYQLEQAAYYQSPEGLAKLDAKQKKDAQISALKQQILASSNTSKWTGEGYGGAEANAKAMAKLLADAGITDIRQFGKVDKYEPVEVAGYTLNGKTVQNPSPGVYYESVLEYDGENGATFSRRDLTPEEAKQVQPTYQIATPTSWDNDGNPIYTPIDPSKIVEKDGKLVGVTGQTFGNKETGEAINRGSGRWLNQGGDNLFSGTGEGKGNTGFRVNIQPDGTPVFYTTYGSSNDLVNLLGNDPILNAIAQIGAAYFGGPAGTAALQAAMGKDAKDIAKSALLSYAGGEVAKGFSNVDAGANVFGQTGSDIATSLVDTFGETGANILAKTAGQTVASEGKVDPLSLLLTNGVNAASSALLNNIDGFKNLDAQQQKLVTGLANSYLNDGKLSPQEAINAAFSAATTAVKNPDQIEAQVKAAKDAAISNELDRQLTIDASGARDVDAAAAFAEAAGFNRFTFDGKTYTLETNNAAKNIAELEAEVKAEQAAAQAATTAANLKGEDFEGYDAAVAANAAANNTVIGNTEADTPEEAAALAKVRNPTGTTFTYGGQTYTLGTSSAAVDQAIAESKTVELQDRIAGAPTRAAAYKIAREELGANKTFTYGGKEYSTATAEERPDLTGKPALAAAVDQNEAETKRLLAQNKTLEDAAVANQSPAEIARLLRQNAELIKGNVTANQSGAETARLRSLNNILVLGNAPNESTAETQRLMEAGERSVAQNIDTMAMQALGTTARGVSSFISNAGQTYAQLTGDFNYDNAATRLGKEIAEYAKSKDVYGLDVQKERITQGLAQANKTDNFFEKVVIIGKTIKNNPLAFFDVAGSEIVEELPETTIQIATALLTGGTSMAVRVGGKFIQGSASLIGSFTENFGSAGKEAYDKSIARGDSEDVARNKAYINASINAVAEMVPSFIADKALVGPIMKGFSEQTLKRLATGYVTNASVGVVSEFISGAAQNYSTQYVVDPTKASWSNAVTSGIFEATIGGTVQTTMATPTTVVDTAAVIGRDYSGKDVTLQQVLDGGSNIDASTVKPDTAIATKADGTKLTVGSSIASAQANNTGIDVIGSFLPSNLTSGDITVSTDVKGNEVTLNELVTDLTGQTANVTGASDTSTVLSVDSSTGTAVVMNAAGNTDVVNVTGAVDVGSVVTVDAATGAATPTGAVEDTTAKTGTVVSVDATSGTAIVTDSTGSSQVVNAGTGVTTGSTVTVDSSGTATATDAATAAATDAATTSAATAATATATDAATTAAAAAQAAADAATTTTNATVVSLDTGTNTALVVDANGSTDIVTVTGDVTVGSTVVVDTSTSTAAAADSATASTVTTDAATVAATAADAATVAATDAATTAANATNATASTDVAAATDAASAATDAATTAANAAAANAAAATAADAATGTVLSVDTTTGTALVVDSNGSTDVVNVTGDVTVGSTVVVDTSTGTAVAADTAVDSGVVTDTGAATDVVKDTSTDTSVVADTGAATDVVSDTGVTTGTDVVSDLVTDTGVVTDKDTVTDVVADTTPVNTSTVIAIDHNNNTIITQDSTGKVHFIDSPGDDVAIGDTVDLPPVLPPGSPVDTTTVTSVSPVDTTVPPVLPPVSPVFTAVSPEVSPASPAVKPPKTPTSPSAPSVGGGGGGGQETAPLANVFYYGKEFGTQKQQVGPGGRLVQAPYQELSVSRPGAEAPVAQQARTEENDADAMLQKILSQQDENVTMDELIRLLG